MFLGIFCFQCSFLLVCYIVRTNGGFLGGNHKRQGQAVLQKSSEAVRLSLEYLSGLRRQNKTCYLPRYSALLRATVKRADRADD